MNGIGSLRSVSHFATIWIALSVEKLSLDVCAHVFGQQTVRALLFRCLTIAQLFTTESDPMGEAVGLLWTTRRAQSDSAKRELAAERYICAHILTPHHTHFRRALPHRVRTTYT